MSQKLHKLTVEAMLRFGGRFVHQLALAYQVADEDNKAKIEDTWPHYFTKYSAMAPRIQSERDQAESG